MTKILKGWLAALTLCLASNAAAYTPVVYFGEDERLQPGAISEARPYLAVGQVVCKLNGPEWEQRGTGTLTPDNIVITAAHIFLNPNGTVFTPPEACVFHVYSDTHTIVKTLLPQRARLLTRQFEKIPERDFAFLDVAPAAHAKGHSSQTFGAVNPYGLSPRPKQRPFVLHIQAAADYLPATGEQLNIVGYSMDIKDYDIRRKVMITVQEKGLQSRYVLHPNIVYHDGDVGPASSGAPLIHPGTGKMVGIHLGGFGGAVYDADVSFNYAALFSREIALEYQIFLSQRGLFL